MKSLVDKLRGHVYHEAQDNEFDTGFNEAKRQAIVIALRHQLEAGERAWRVMDQIDQSQQQVLIGVPGHVWGIPTDAATDYLNVMLNEVFPSLERYEALKDSRASD